jgi:hypothetical protein
MGLPKEIRILERAWNSADANLENELLLYDFFRREEGYAAERPLIVCKDGGLMALYRMDGLDPEPLGGDGLAGASASLRRAFDVLNPASLEGEWKRGTWEVQNIFTRAEGAAPTIAPPTRDSAALRYLCDATNAYWRQKTVFHDEILWVFKYIPRFREKRTLSWPVWRLRNAQTEVLLKLEDLRAEARMVRRVLRVIEENLLAFTTRRPKMGFGLKPLNEEESFVALWRQVNRRWTSPGPLRADLPLLVQVASSERDNTSEQYRIEGRLTKVLTWKVPPAESIAYLFARLQNEVRFPLTLAQTFRALDFAQIGRGISRLANFAGALAGKHRESALYHAEAQDFLTSVRTENACPFNWYFTVIVQGDTLAELEDRTAKLGTQMKLMGSGDVLEERANRVLAELSTLPGNGQYGLRLNRVTSRQAGDLAMAYRLSPGDKAPFLLFGDRKGGVFSYSLFSRREPSWNKAVLGLPGSGKSMLMNAFLLGNAMFESQGYVIDKGNSFGPIFELLAQEMPNEVAVMRLRGGEFRFNPFPLVWALEERARQVATGEHRMVLEGGEQLSCPVEDARLFFESWLDCLVGQKRGLEPAEKNRLDRALKGEDGKGGFFRDFENQASSYLRARRAKVGGRPPRPLSALLTHLKNEAPEFVPAVELWTRAPRDRFFDSGTDSVANAKYLYFELSGLEDDELLAVPFVSALMGTIWRRIQNPRAIKERKAVIIDEAWSFLAHPAFFRLVEDMFRTIRKFNGLVTLSTQSPKDVKDGDARKLLQTMSEVFLYRGFSEPDFMENDLHLTAHHQKLHESLREDDEVREVFYVSKNGLNRVLSVEISPALYWYATTDGEDKHWRTLFCRQFGFVEGIRRLVEACEGRTIAGGELRLSKVRAYAKTAGVGELPPAPAREARS